MSSEAAGCRPAPPRSEKANERERLAAYLDTDEVSGEEHTSLLLLI